MSNKKLSKAEVKLLKQYAGQLKPIWHTAKRRTFVKGYELIHEGKVEIDGIAINAKATYVRVQNVQVPINHFRRIREAWIHNGQEGIEIYLNTYRSIVENSSYQNLQHAES